jgi:hypothetical protein
MRSRVDDNIAELPVISKTPSQMMLDAPGRWRWDTRVSPAAPACQHTEGLARVTLQKPARQLPVSLSVLSKQQTATNWHEFL